MQNAAAAAHIAQTLSQFQKSAAQQQQQGQTTPIHLQSPPTPHHLSMSQGHGHGGGAGPGLNNNNNNSNSNHLHQHQQSRGSGGSTVSPPPSTPPQTAITPFLNINSGNTPRLIMEPAIDETTDLEELEQFAKTFKQRRIKLG